ncbi:lantibiotic dehydratase [Streptomyces albulus]|nr:lantibiotic dehydratase [Streptomyces noursei]
MHRSWWPVGPAVRTAAGAGGRPRGRHRGRRRGPAHGPEVSVRNTVVVQAVRELAHRPLRGAELARALRQRFPGATEETVYATLGELVAKDILLTEARPPLEAADPLRHVLRACAGVPDAHLPELAELRTIEGELSSYAATEVGGGSAALERVHGRMRRLYDRPSPLRVDLVLDVEVRLPGAVAEEAARAAELSWRLGPRRSEPRRLREYREAFVERYGTDRVVPVLEALDPDVGLGAPAGYRRPGTPAGPGGRGRPGAGPDPGRVGPTGAVGRRFRGGVDGRPPRGAPPGPRRRVATGVLALHARLLAASAEALSDGRFGLVLTGGAGPAGAVFGGSATSSTIVRAPSWAPWCGAGRRTERCAPR